MKKKAPVKKSLFEKIYYTLGVIAFLGVLVFPIVGVTDFGGIGINIALFALLPVVGFLALTILIGAGFVIAGIWGADPWKLAPYTKDICGIE